MKPQPTNTDKPMEGKKKILITRYGHDDCKCNYTTDMDGNDIDGVICTKHFQQALAAQREEIRQAIIDEVKGSGEMWFPYEGCGDTTKEEALEAAEMFADSILDSLRNSDKKKSI